MANYTSGSESNTLLFHYTIESGHSSSDLEYLNTSALYLQNTPFSDGTFIYGTIKDMFGLSANLDFPEVAKIRRGYCYPPRFRGSYSFTLLIIAAK